MKHRWSGLALGVGTFALLAALGAAPARAAAPAGETAERGPALGSVAPDFSLTASDGSAVRLSDYRGQAPVVLVFFRGTW